MKCLLSLFVGLFLSQGALAQFIVNPSMTYHQRSIDDTGVSLGQVDTLYLDIQTGWLMKEHGLFLGWTAGFTTGQSGLGDTQSYQMGPTVGYTSDDIGFFVTLTYHLLGLFEIRPDGSDNQYERLSGLQVNLGYPVAITDTLSLGPQLIYRNLDHNNITNASKRDTEELSPYLALWFQF